jgi:hypothetical protein
MTLLTEHKAGTKGAITWIANSLLKLYPMFKKNTILTIINNDPSGIIVKANEKTFAMNKQAASLIGIKQI